jgi:hypothetical protein
MLLMEKSPTYKAAVYLLLPLMWANLTAGENRWEILGFGVGQSLYWIIIGLAWYVAFRSPYQKIATALLLCAFALRPIEAMGGGAVVYALRSGALAAVFTIAGAWIYGRDPHFLHRQLVVFLGLCVPLMFLQMLGVSSLVMGWSTAYLNDPSGVMDDSEVGTFMEVPLYPTLFVGSDDLILSVGQARPVGLMHASNVLSIFVAIAVALNLVIPRSARLRAGDLIVTAAVVLTMSKMVFGVMAMLYVGAILCAPMERKVLTLKLLCVLAVGLWAYYLLFPGLLETNLSQDMVRVSIMLRLLGVLNSIGIENVGAFLYDQQQLIGAAFNEDEKYSTVALLLSSGVATPVFVTIGAAGLLYLHRLRQMRLGNAWGYAVLLLVCVATQFAIPFATASSFQLILGLALFPLFPRLWRDRIPARQAILRSPGPGTFVPSTR